jgi:hypothetical protein
MTAEDASNKAELKTIQTKIEEALAVAPEHEMSSQDLTECMAYAGYNASQVSSAKTAMKRDGRINIYKGGPGGHFYVQLLSSKFVEVQLILLPGLLAACFGTDKQALLPEIGQQ